MIGSKDLVVLETIYDSGATRVTRGKYRSEIPVIVKSTVQDIPGESLIRQYNTSSLAQKKIDHGAVNKVLDEVTSGAGRTLILEDIGGITLKQWIQSTLAEHSVWPLEDPSLFHNWMLRLLNWSISLAEGISACHQKNIIHNDINPANVVVNPTTNKIQLIDFGAAFLDGENINEWTVVEQHRTLTYISPEQTGRLNRNIDYRSDYYALGATLYQLFCGCPPFVAHDLPELIHCHIARHPVPMVTINPLIPESLSALVAKLMAKAPEDRYQNGRCVIHDLKAIERAMTSGIPFPLSALGRNDVQEQLLIPAKLYGREAELELLKQALAAEHGKPALIAVEGEAGGGKTALITEAALHAVDSPRQLLAGKNDAYNKKPHNALSQALAQSVDGLLSLPDSQFIPWRNALLEALNHNPHTLIGLCPELVAIFETADFAKKAQLHNADIQLKLHTAVFLQHLSVLDPILLFIDDVQWCDGPSIALLEALIRANHPRITVMVTCRSEEAGVDHAYTLMKDRIKENDISMEVISLVNLDLGQVAQLLTATFHLEKQRVLELADIIFRKTLGNPLFVHEFLKAAHHRNDNTLFYDNRHGKWDWDQRKLLQIGSSGNVAALLIDALHQQDKHTQELLQWAACIGTRFNEKLLALVTETPVKNITQYLNSVYKHGYIHRIADIQGNYAFNHDRIRQACYELQPWSEVALRHWAIGQLCCDLEEGDLSSSDDPLPHFVAALRDGGQSRMFQDNEKIVRTMRALYEGSLSAKEKTANDIALQYINSALVLYEKMDGDDYDQLSQLLLAQGELGYLTADIALGGKAFDLYRVINVSRTLQAASFSQQAPLAFMRGDVEESINCSLNCFRLLGVDTPGFGEDISLPLQFQRDIFESLDGFKKISKLDVSSALNLNETSILQSTASNMLLLLGMRASYEWAEWFGLVGINNFLISGFSKSTLQLLAIFDSLVLSSNQYKFDQTIVERTLKITENNHHFSGIGFVFGNIGAYSGRYSRTMEQCISILEKGAKVSFEKGDYLSYMACFSTKIVVAFSAGMQLQKLQESIEEHQGFLVSCGEFVTAGKYYSKLLEQLMVPESTDTLKQSSFTGTQWSALSNSAAFGAYHHLCLQNFFWHGEYQRVVDHYQKEKNELEKLHGMASEDDNHFLYVIACLQSVGAKYGEFAKGTGYSVEDSIKNIEDLARVYPPNFRHKALLIQAEQKRLSGDEKATDYYQYAATDAKENGFIQMYALAHELHAMYWQQEGRPDYSQHHITKAIQGYQRWGCSLRLEMINEKFSSFLSYRAASSSLNLASELQLMNDVPSGTSSRMTHSYQHPTQGLQGQKRLLKIANAVAEELDLNQRLSQIIQLAVENTGAESGVVLLKHGTGYRACASAKLLEREGENKCEVSLTNHADVPDKLIARCAASKELFLSKGDSITIDYPQDAFYPTANVQSLLCYPVVYKGDCQSLILLTHSGRRDAFTPQNIQFLKTLAPQFAVSIENAQLYQERQYFNLELEEKVEQRTQELQAANEELQAFTASVSHDLKAPLRAISGFTAALFEDCEQSLGDLGKNYVQLLVEASDSMGQIIDGLLTLSRSTQTTLRWEEVNLSTLVGDKIRWLRTMEPDHVLKESIQQGLTANGDLRLIRQVVDNLIANAWKYSHDEIAPSIEFGLISTEKSSHTFYVRDNGVGFDAANAEELFMPFRRFHGAEEFEGSGIGLATAYRIVKRHGGQIWVDSQPNQGATFYFTLKGIST